MKFYLNPRITLFALIIMNGLLMLWILSTTITTAKLLLTITSEGGGNFVPFASLVIITALVISPILLTMLFLYKEKQSGVILSMLISIVWIAGSALTAKALHGVLLSFSVLLGVVQFGLSGFALLSKRK